MYFVISNCDGDTFVRQFSTKEKLLKNISEDGLFFGEIPDHDTNYWEGSIIIKGEIVVPREKTRVVELDID